ncbi:hypothetical protein B0H65DRAFT_239333, partial [Neurospora tetraspora]
TLLSALFSATPAPALPTLPIACWDLPLATVNIKTKHLDCRKVFDHPTSELLACSDRRLASGATRHLRFSAQTIDLGRFILFNSGPFLPVIGHSACHCDGPKPPATKIRETRFWQRRTENSAPTSSSATDRRLLRQARVDCFLAPSPANDNRRRRIGHCRPSAIDHRA